MSFIFQKNGDYLVFYAKNQKACIWGIRQDELSLDSPPVYHHDDEQIWQKEHGTLSDFVSYGRCTSSVWLVL
ncbi:hypothetical protein [Moraxella sp. VT-16-12]|uniref:hypothetical protein n=1 Tax=Moraxella sp. VT-16-12 TaxID=2014877 RepID=UPI000B7FE07E|nr:hypothetical protein [Moraxella sp. VT-16-12]TWV81299.1 hypothetical protein CEW93_008275 [Moraxella sp. VT-16-12]